MLSDDRRSVKLLKNAPASKANWSECVVERYETQRVRQRFGQNYVIWARRFTGQRRGTKYRPLVFQRQGSMRYAITEDVLTMLGDLDAAVKDNTERVQASTVNFPKSFGKLMLIFLLLSQTSLFQVKIEDVLHQKAFAKLALIEDDSVISKPSKIDGMFSQLFSITSKPF